MSILKTLQISFLLVSLLPSVLLTYLAFEIAGNEMREQIKLNMQQEAITVSHSIDMMLFERIQNAETWRRLEVLQDIHTDDLDKRLSKFLAGLKNGYGDVYISLLCTNNNGKIIASSNSSEIGKNQSSLMVSPNNSNNNTLVDIEPINDYQKNQSSLAIRTNVPSLFGEGNIGFMYLIFNWNKIYRILDDSAQTDHDLIVIDEKGKIIAASEGLREQSVLLKDIPKSWMTRSKTEISTYQKSALYDGDVMVASANITSTNKLPNLNWSVLVIKRSDQALIPVRQMAIVFLILLAITSFIAVGSSYIIAGRISRPITALTRFTRRFMMDKEIPSTPEKISGEVGELTEAFVQTMQDLDQSRANLIRVSKLAVLGELAAVMAHEIRTPIGILRSSAQMLSREKSLSPEGRELTGFVESETERLNKLVSTLLNSARPPIPKFALSDITLVIRHSVDLLSTQAKNKCITIETRFQLHPMMASIDEEQITQVIINLLLNAIQILPNNGSILISAVTNTKHFVIEVSDNGPGILEGEISRVFDPFFTKREGGVGLGLAVVHQIIGAHGGDITVSNRDSGGATFKIILPTERSHD